jgi:biopolymer transport protein ExbB/TolQ
MTAFSELLKAGGPILIPIMLLSVILYERCSTLLVFLVRSRRRLVQGGAARPGDVLALRKAQDDLLESFWRQRATISAMIKAAPLLGLLGTVIGMIHTFDNLALEAGKKSVEGLTGGISVALISTEAGLGVAIPAILVLYFAQRQVQKAVHTLVEAEGRSLQPA